LGLIESETGFRNPNENYGQLTKIKATDSFLQKLLKITDPMIQDVSPPELVILKNRNDKKNIDYRDSKKIINIRDSLKEYNILRQQSVFNLSNLTNDEISAKKRYLDLFSIGCHNEGEILLRNPYIYRVFNNNFLYGGRYYNGIESNMPKTLRSKLKINNNETIELDYSCLHIQMLYNLEGLQLKQNAYDQLAGDDNILRAIYKLIGLVSINANNIKSALNGIRNEIREIDYYKILPDLSDKSLMPMYQRWIDEHKPISKYFNSDIGIKLQYYDSVIAAGIIKYFTEKSISVLVIHDSFVIEKKYKDELLDIMNSEYKKKFKFEPNIK
ncbi:MAG: hypothetical protein LH629_11035, partial [Ignavibacteria bacterium]|nr:hypothetical protein [Ignavibacteria bacterium]